MFFVDWFRFHGIFKWADWWVEMTGVLTFIWRIFGRNKLVWIKNIKEVFRKNLGGKIRCHLSRKFVFGLHKSQIWLCFEGHDSLCLFNLNQWSYDFFIDLRRWCSQKSSSRRRISADFQKNPNKLKNFGPLILSLL